MLTAKRLFRPVVQIRLTVVCYGPSYAHDPMVMEAP